MNVLNASWVLANTNPSLGEHTDKLGWLLDRVIQLPFAALLLGFAGLGLYWAWRQWGKYLWKVNSLTERQDYLTGLHNSLSNEQEALLLEISDDYVDSKQKLERREHHVKELHYRLSLRDDELAEANAENERLQAELDAVDADREKLEELTVAYDKLQAESEQDRDKHYQRLQELNHELSTTGTELEELRGIAAEVDGFKDQASTVGQLEQNLEGLKNVIEEKNVELAKLETELAEKAELESTIANLQSNISEQDSSIESLQLQLQNVGAEEQNAVAELNEKLDQAGSWEVKANSLLLDLTERDRTISSLKEQLQGDDSRDAELVELRNALAEAQGSATQSNEELDELRSLLASRDAELVEAQEAIAAPVATGFEGEDVHEDEALGILYRSRPDHADDLKEISGVADVLEEKLHNHGVYCFKQIAIWNDEQVAEFGERLSFRDRIDRDLWVNQAVDLHYDKYGQRLTPQVSIYRKPPSNRNGSKERSVEDLKHEETAVMAFQGETVETHHRYGVVFTKAPNKLDDLKKIKGVGKVLESALNKFGVYQYKQIALWSPRIVNEFVEELPFGDRVTRDHWIGQASDLHERKYGEKVN